MMKNWESFEDIEPAQHRRAWLLAALSLATLFFFLPASAFLGWARFFPGPRLLRPGVGPTLVFYLPIFLGGIYFALLAPFLRAGFLVPLEKPLRLLAVLFLWGLPLLSFAYWMGDFKNAFHAYEAGWLFFGALAVPLILYWRTGATAVLCVGVGLGAFVPLFVVEDILGPFSPLWVYASEGPGLYFLRTFCVAAAVWIAAVGTVPKIGRAKENTAVFRLCTIALAVLSMGIQFGEWAASREAVGLRLFSPDLNWVGYLVLLYFLRRTDRFAKRAFMAVSVLLVLSLLAQTGLLVWTEDSGHWGQLRFFTSLVGIAMVGLQVQRRWSQERKFNSYSVSEKGKRKPLLQRLIASRAAHSP